MDLEFWGVWGFNQAVDGGDVAEVGGAFPVVVSTWPFREAVRAAWEVVSASDGGGSALDAVVAGCSACEVLRCDGTGQSFARVLHLAANGTRVQL
jgi:N4-(beta-N-acetylglucosaminyl)-L-asparaginase